MIAPAYKVQPVKALHPYKNNARTHSALQVEKLAHSIEAFGFTNPVLVDEHGEVIAGHGRLLAAKRLKLTEVPTVVLGGLTTQEKRALVIADNKLALDAGWDMHTLQAELLDLNSPGFDFSLTGFTVDEATRFFIDLDSLPTSDPGESPGVSGEKDEDLEKCRTLLKRDKGFREIVDQRFAMLGGAR